MSVLGHQQMGVGLVGGSALGGRYGQMFEIVGAEGFVCYYSSFETVL
jgi:hypothetical protein